MKAFFIAFLIFFTPIWIFGQVPDIMYSTPNFFIINTPISPLVVSNSGGLVPNAPFVSTVAGNGSIGAVNANGASASFNYPTVVTLDNSGSIIVVDRSNHKIRNIDLNNEVTTISGNGTIGSMDGIVSTATYNYPDGAVVDSNGNIFITDQSNHKIRKISTAGIVSTFAGSGVAGFLDGAGATARFYYPAALAIDASDNLIIADYSNHRIRKITPNGIVSTFAGTGISGSLDGITTNARFNGPTGIGIDSFGTVFVADYGNHKIRKIAVDGTVSTFAGSGVAGAIDNTGNLATFNRPAVVAIDSNNELFITDQNNHKIRKISTAGVVSTFAGIGTIGALDGDFSSASFNSPSGIVVDSNDDLIIADYGNHKIRKVSKYGFRISPVLPLGLIFNKITGEISGTPTVISSNTIYTITASNQYGSSSFDVAIEVTSLNIEEFNLKGINVYPNPIIDKLNVTGIEFINSITISNSLGQIFEKINGGNLNQTIDLTYLQSGIYYIMIESPLGSKKVKVVKM